MALIFQILGMCFGSKGEKNFTNWDPREENQLDGFYLNNGEEQLGDGLWCCSPQFIVASRYAVADGNFMAKMVDGTMSEDN